MSLLPANNSHNSRALLFNISHKHVHQRFLFDKQMKEEICENNMSLESPVVPILWMTSFNPMLELPHFQKLQTTLNFSGISISCLCVMDEQLQGLCYNFPSKTQGSNCKGGLRAVQITGFSVQLPSQTVEKECWFKLNRIHNFSRFPHQNHYHPHPAHCTSFNMKCSMCLKSIHFWKMQTFGKCKHKRQGSARQDLLNRCRIVLSEYLYTIHSLLYWGTFFLTVLTTTGFAPASKVPLTSG